MDARRVGWWASHAAIFEAPAGVAWYSAPGNRVQTTYGRMHKDLLTPLHLLSDDDEPERSTSAGGDGDGDGDGAGDGGDGSGKRDNNGDGAEHLPSQALVPVDVLVTSPAIGMYMAEFVNVNVCRHE